MRGVAFSPPQNRGSRSNIGKKNKEMFAGGTSLTTTDGFVNVNQGMEEMIKNLGNEPSVGLFFVQKHAQAVMPNLVSLKDKVVDTSRESVFNTEDLEDSILSVRSMSKLAIPIADRMIKDITTSLSVFSTSPPRHGLIRNQSLEEDSKIRPKASPSSSSSLYNYSSGSTLQKEPSQGYLSKVLKSETVQKAATRLGWSQRDSTSKEHGYNEMPMFTSDQQIVGHQQSNEVAYMIDNYEQSNSERVAKLAKWLDEEV